MSTFLYFRAGDIHNVFLNTIGLGMRNGELALIDVDGSKSLECFAFK